MKSNDADGIRFVVVGFTDPTQIRAGFEQLTELAAAGSLKVIDVEFIHSIHGVASTVPADRVDHTLRALNTLDTGLLDQTDLDIVAGAIPVGSTSAVVVCTGDAALPVFAAWSRAGVAMVRSGPVDPVALEAARAGLPGAGLLRG